jgi:hypothetical protein
VADDVLLLDQFFEGGVEALERLRGNILPPVPAGSPVHVQEVPHDRATVEEAVASPPVRRPNVAVRIATFPESIVREDNKTYAANNPILSQDYVAKANGEIMIEVLLISGAATTMQMTLDGQQNWGNLNGGANLIVGSWFRERHEIHEGDMLNFRFGGQVQASIRVTFREGV